MNNEQILSSDELLDVVGGANFISAKELISDKTYPILKYGIPYIPVTKYGIPVTGPIMPLYGIYPEE